MAEIAHQLGLDHTYFVQLGLFAAVFFVLSRVYFRPFLRLFESRHKRTVEDREAAERIIADANGRFAEYEQLLAGARMAAKQEYESVLAKAKLQEAEILGAARKEARRITQDAAADIEKQRDLLRKELEKDVETLAASISQRLLVSSGSGSGTATGKGNGT